MNTYNYSAGFFFDTNIKAMNKNIMHKLYLYDNFYKDNSEIITLFKMDENNCINPLISEFKHIFEHILDAEIQTIQSNIIKLTNDHNIQPSNNEWVAVVFLNSNIPMDNGLAFLQENFNSNNKIKQNCSVPTTLITEDFFLGKPNRIIIFNSKYYHKLIVKVPMVVEIIYIKLI
tara:strand:+ start:153 stop:674 length:522 start_codon:yes stop_codon:yes gene_type:complete